MSGINERTELQGQHVTLDLEPRPCIALYVFIEATDSVILSMGVVID